MKTKFIETAQDTTRSAPVPLEVISPEAAETIDVFHHYLNDEVIALAYATATLWTRELSATDHPSRLKESEQRSVHDKTFDDLCRKVVHYGPDELNLTTDPGDKDMKLWNAPFSVAAGFVTGTKRSDRAIRQCFLHSVGKKSAGGQFATFVINDGSGRQLYSQRGDAEPQPHNDLPDIRAHLRSAAAKRGWNTRREGAASP